MNRLLQNVQDLSFQSIEDWERAISAFLVFLVGFIVLRVGARMLMRTLGKGLREQSRELLRKTILYIGTAILFVFVLNAAGVSVGGLLGAAGVLGIAIGIASQASLSNIISGLFLVSERFFEIGDVVRFREQTGIVQTIDLLSIKIKTFDNVLIRVPNQQLIENELINITRYPIRRMDFTIVVPQRQDVERAIEALGVAAQNVPQILEEPEPFVMAIDFADNGLSLKLGVWFERPNYVKVRNALVAQIQRVFLERSIEIRGCTIVVENAGTGKGERKALL